MVQKRYVISVVGPGRSGTTVLGGILGEVDGVFCPGELRWLWSRGVLGSRRCGCGALITECAIWSQVLARGNAEPALAAATDQRAAAEAVVAWQGEIATGRQGRQVLNPSSTNGSIALEDYTEVLGATLDEIFAVTGASVIVDTSKRPQDAAVIARIPGLEHVVVQMVRDPRAVAHSWGRVKKLPTNDKSTAMGTRGPWSSLWRWTQNGLRAEHLRRNIPADRWLFIRYEDFVADPRSAIDDILCRVSRPHGDNPIQADGSVSMSGNHTVAGNPNRFDRGAVKIRSDDEWMRAVPRARQVMLGLAALPLMRKYKYPVKPTADARVSSDGAATTGSG
ncbi:MAG: sulfotransferase [Actinomycetes bacterium]